MRVEIFQETINVDMAVGSGVAEPIYVEISDTGLQPLADRTATFYARFDTGGLPIEAGDHGEAQIPISCTVIGWSLLATGSGDISIDIRKSTFAEFNGDLPSDPADSITGNTPPTLTGASKAQSDTLTGWSPGIAAGEVLRFAVLAPSVVQAVTLSLKVLRS